MMIQRIRFIAVGLVIILLSVACSNTKSNKPAGNTSSADGTFKKAGEALDDASKAMEQQMVQLKTEMSANIATINQKLQQMQTKKDAMTDAKSKSDMDARLKELKKQRDDLQTRIDQIESQKKDETSWKKFEDDTKAAWHDLENGVKDLFDKLGS